MEKIALLPVKELLFYFDLLGTLAFAISGSMAAANKKLDLFGAAFIAFVTAVGGGTVRDLLVGQTPVDWMQNSYYLLVILFGVLLTYLFQKKVRQLRKTLFLFDTIGIAVFTILGVKKTLILGIDPYVALIMGMFSATLGGIIRDMLINQIPLIFRKEIYAVACLMGGGLFVVLEHFGMSFELNAILSILSVIVIRILAIKFKIGLSGIADEVKFPFMKSYD